MQWQCVGAARRCITAAVLSWSTLNCSNSICCFANLRTRTDFNGAILTYPVLDVRFGVSFGFLAIVIRARMESETQSRIARIYTTFPDTCIDVNLQPVL